MGVEPAKTELTENLKIVQILKKYSRKTVDCPKTCSDSIHTFSLIKKGTLGRIQTLETFCDRGLNTPNGESVILEADRIRVSANQRLRFRCRSYQIESCQRFALKLLIDHRILTLGNSPILPETCEYEGCSR